MIQIDNAVIMAAGKSERFVPLSYEKPKGLLEVHGEILIERQIRQLRDAGIRDIYVVTGYMAECFSYLPGKFGVRLIRNNDYETRNNHSSIRAARDVLGNSYICSSDNYFRINPFASEEDAAYYAALYANGTTSEWCMTVDDEDFITDVTVGGEDAWYMLGHALWDETFSGRFREILEDVYGRTETKDKLWEAIYREHIDDLSLKIRRYGDEDIFEFDTLDELRLFDRTYCTDPRSKVIDWICGTLSCRPEQLTGFRQLDNGAAGRACTFSFGEESYVLRIPGRIDDLDHSAKLQVGRDISL